MEATEKIRLAEANIRQALEDYGRHTSQTEVLDNVSDSFIVRLAKDNYFAKQELRELFRKSPVWNEELDALVINGSRTHDPDYERIDTLACQILSCPLNNMAGIQRRTLRTAIQFFSNPKLTDKEKADAIAAIQALAPKAYAPNKKPTRIFRALCVALGVADETVNSNFPYQYAQLADEMTSKRIDFKLFVSLNPAHFITMSNPKDDDRGCTLTSCHSFNSTEYSYNNGCTGYARDEYTFIVFTVVDPTNAETLNNRKNRRQIFWYKPGNGVLFQSRLYNDAGGTHREQTESKIFRDLVQREISALEEKPNLWRTFKYYNNSEITFLSGCGFGGYADWEHEDFNAKVSIRADHEGNYKNFSIGTYGLCISCGSETSEGLYCDYCNCNDVCEVCGEHFPENSLYPVHDGEETLNVCDYCRDNHYTYCADCEEYYHIDEMTEDAYGRYICPHCLESSYVRCDCCNAWIDADSSYSAVNTFGEYVYLCEDCCNNHYTYCDDCEELVHESDVETAYDKNGHERIICRCCASHYERCEDCDRLFETSMLVNGLCPDCATDISDNDNIPKEETA